MNNIKKYIFSRDDLEMMDEVIYNNEITHLYFKDKSGLLYYCIIAPHEGNDNKYLLRVNAQKTFDR